MRSNGDVRSSHNKNDGGKGELIQFPGPFWEIVGKNRILVKFVLPKPKKQVDKVECRDEDDIAFALFQELIVNFIFFVKRLKHAWLIFSVTLHFI